MKRIEYLIEKFDEISDKIGKHNVMLIAFIVVVLLITGLYSTFSLFTSSEGPEVIGGLTTYKFILDSELSDTSIMVPANTDRNLDIVITNDEDSAMKYGIYYSATGDVTIGYTSNTNNPVSGTIEASSAYTVSIKIGNTTNDDITVDLGVSYGFESGGDLALPSGSKLITDMYPIKLSQVPVGSYVKYNGTNGCVDGHCDGTNANYVEGSTMGYCAADSYPFTSSGWRVGYVKDGSSHLITAGSPECMCTNSDGTTSDTSCDTYDTSVGLSQHLGNLDRKALTYCNSLMAYAGICDNTTVWSFNPTDFRNITGSGMYYNSSDDISCLNGNGENCGSGNDLIDNGGYYWINGAVTEGSLTMAMHWFPYFHYATYNDSSFTYGVRPVVKIDPSIVVTSGSGTYEDPFIIDNPNFKRELATDYIINKYNDGSTITTVNIGGDTSKPQVHLNSTQGIMLDNNGDYRYYGANPNNYVSYNDELWRIISVGNVKSSETDTTGETRVKIVKADILTDDNGLSAYSYDSSVSSVNSGYGVNDWSKSDLMTELNTLYFNSTSGTCYTGRNNVTTACNFTNTGLSAEARNLTADALYYLGGNSTASGVYPNDYYTFERGTTVYSCSKDSCGGPRATTWTGRVGIIYPSDFAYATDLSVCTKDGYNYDNANCKNNDWLLDTSHQWTISPRSSYANYAFGVSSTGGVGYDYVYGAVGVRAVQYLRSEVTIIEGEGTDEKPYILGT